MKENGIDMESRVIRAKKNMIWTAIRNILGMLLPFVTQTFLILYLGVQYVGLNGLFTSVLGVLNLAELGFGSALVFSMYKPLAAGDEEKVCALLAYYKKCYRIIGCVVLALGLCVMPFIKHFISGEIPDDINVYALYVVYLLNAVLTYFMFAYKTSLLNACQRVDLISILDSILFIVRTFFQCIAIYFMRNYFVFVCVIPFATIVRNLCGEWLTKKIYPQYIPKGAITNDEVKNIKDKVNGLICQKVGNVLLLSTDSIFISAFLGLTISGLYSNYMYIYNGIVCIIAVIVSSITPIIGNSIATESKEKNYDNFRKLFILFSWFVSWCAICEVCLIQPFMQIWVGNEKMFPNETMIFFVIYLYSTQIGNTVYMYKEATGVWKEGRYVYLISAGVNMLLDYILIQYLGVTGVLLASIICLLGISIPIGGRVLFSVYFTYPKAFSRYIFSQLLHLIFTVGIGILTYYVCSSITFVGIPCLIVRLIICIFVPNLCFLIIYYKHPDLKGTSLLVKSFVK
jgi:O-antigen/teichoic acid export membrane protein